MKKIIITTALLAATAAIQANSAVIDRNTSLSSANAAKAQFTIQVSGGCTGRASYSEQLEVQLKNRYETDIDGKVQPDKFTFLLTAIAKHPAGTSQQLLFSTGENIGGNYERKKLSSSSEKFSESVKKDLAIFSYSTSSPSLLFLPFVKEHSPAGNIQQRLSDLANISNCISAYTNNAIQDVYELDFYRSTAGSVYHDPNTYWVDSSKKNKITAKASFGKNTSTELYTVPQTLAVKASMSGVLLPTKNQCSGKLQDNTPTKLNCKVLPPVKYKITFLIEGDIAS